MLGFPLIDIVCSGKERDPLLPHQRSSLRFMLEKEGVFSRLVEFPNSERKTSQLEHLLTRSISLPESKDNQIYLDTLHRKVSLSPSYYPTIKG